ncbi:unnamed protein product [Rhizophagus irregularis]|nr:unnamed protein product [Rhizophagus irregularis]
MPFSYCNTIVRRYNFSGRNDVLPRHKKLSLLFCVGNNEGDKMELQDEMGDKCNNNFRDKDNNNDDSSEENEENITKKTRS